MARKIPFDAFDAYVALGPGRSYAKIAEKYHVSKRALTAHAVKERWQEKAAELERKAREAANQKTVETLEGMVDRHLKALRVVQGKALTALASMSLDNAMDAVRALDIALRQERALRGEPTDRIALSIEDTIKKEYANWLTTAEKGKEWKDGDGDERASDEDRQAGPVP